MMASVIEQNYNNLLLIIALLSKPNKGGKIFLTLALTLTSNEVDGPTFFKSSKDHNK